MGKIFHKLYYHVIWTPYLRQPLISPEIEKVLYPFIENKAKRFHCTVLGIGGMPDHIHVVIQIPPAESISDIIGKIKGSSSYFLNKELQIIENFSWEDGFGVLSFAERDLPKVLHYIKGQKRHHDSKSLNTIMEQTIAEEG